MVDLSEVKERGPRRQRAIHTDDATWERLRKGATLSGLDMSGLVTKLAWDDLRLPDDPPPVPIPAEAREEISLDD